MSATVKTAGKTVGWVDDRLASSNFLKRNMGKVFPEHWSFMLGEIALYSFIVVMLSGVYLTLFFKPSMIEIAYNGSYVPLKGVQMSEAYASTLDISFDIRGGLLMRQIHHWSALFFIAAISVHLCRVFFTGAFRKPREMNWVIGVGLLTMALLAGFAGYSLPDDLLSGTGLRIAQGIMLSIPLIGTYLSFFVFGGEFPGTDFISRLYAVHILVVPGLILALLTAHLIMVWYQKHTQFPGPGRTNDNVVGYRILPIYMAKAGGFFFVVFGIITLISGLVTINPIWLYGPYTPDQVTAGSQPDWYIGWLEGALRMMPNVEWVIFGYTISWNILVPAAIVPGIIFTVMGLYPWIEQWATGDKSRAPPAGPAPERPCAYLAGSHGAVVLHPALGRRRQRLDRQVLRSVDQRHHVVPPDSDLRGPATGVHRHQTHLPGPATPRSQQAAARHGDGQHPAPAAR